MTENLRRAACLVLFGASLLAAGCSAAVDSESAEGEAVDSTEQAYAFSDCAANCESEYNDGYYQCQIGLGNWSCYMYIQNRLNVCLSMCPPCDYAGLASCESWCSSNADPQDQGICFQNCHIDYCG